MLYFGDFPSFFSFFAFFSFLSLFFSFFKRFSSSASTSWIFLLGDRSRFLSEEELAAGEADAHKEHRQYANGHSDEEESGEQEERRRIRHGHQSRRAPRGRPSSLSSRLSTVRGREEAAP